MTEYCSSREIHEPHEARGAWFTPVFWCAGLREQTVTLTGIADWTLLRDETAPLLARQLPGVIVESFENETRSPIPGAWRGATLCVIGLDPKTADALVNNLRWAGFRFVEDFSPVWFEDRVTVRDVTDGELDRLVTSRRRTKP